MGCLDHVRGHGIKFMWQTRLRKDEVGGGEETDPYFSSKSCLSVDWGQRPRRLTSLQLSKHDSLPFGFFIFRQWELHSKISLFLTSFLILPFLQPLPEEVTLRSSVTVCCTGYVGSCLGTKSWMTLWQSRLLKPSRDPQICDLFMRQYWDHGGKWTCQTKLSLGHHDNTNIISLKTNV